MIDLYQNHGIYHIQPNRCAPNHYLRRFTYFLCNHQDTIQYSLFLIKTIACRLLCSLHHRPLIRPNMHQDLGMTRTYLYIYQIASIQTQVSWSNFQDTQLRWGILLIPIAIRQGCTSWPRIVCKYFRGLFLLCHKPANPLVFPWTCYKIYNRHLPFLHLYHP